MSFDRAAGYYDATRSLTPEAMAAVVEVLVGALADHQPVLEIGVGTGRVAVPLAEAGLEVVGIDLSDAMLRQLVAKDGRLPLARADGTLLPFADGAFGAVVASHVLHLVPEWRAAVQDVLRVVRPGGAFLYARGGLGERSDGIAEAFAAGAGIDRTPPGLEHVEGLDAWLRSRHWVGEWLPAVDDDRLVSALDLVEVLESGVMGWTWAADDAARRRGGEAARAWVHEHVESPDEPRPIGRPVRFRRYTARP